MTRMFTYCFLGGLLLTLFPKLLASEVPSYRLAAGERGADGWYEIDAGGGQRPLMLPRPGEKDSKGKALNSCLPGSAVAANWSPDGRFLAVEVDGAGTHSICLYDLSYISAQSNATHSVQARRLTTTGPLVPATGFVKRVKARSGLVTETDLAWGPRKGDSLPFVVSRSGAGPGYRTFALSDVVYPEKASTFPVDGGGPTVGQAPVYQTLQPTWSLDRPSRSQPLAIVVKDRGGCGDSHIALASAASNAVSALRTITEPCKDPAVGSSRTSDRYPVWRPRADAPTLAFVRSVIGQSHRICLVQPGSPAVCNIVPTQEAGRVGARYYPGWSADGRFLAWFFTPNLEPGLEVPLEGEDRIELWSPEKGTVVQEVLAKIRANPRQAPALVSAKEGGAWIFAPTESAEKDGLLLARKVGGTSISPIKTLPTTLRNIIATSAIRLPGEGIRLAIIAQGYADVRGSDMSGKKVYLMNLTGDLW